MIKAIDTNILLDILIPNPAYLESSLNYLLSAEPQDELIISPVVYAELGAQFLSNADLLDFLKKTGIKMVPLNDKALFEASRAWKSYNSQKRQEIVCPSCGKPQKVICSSCGKVIPRRQHILSDFLIGAHAKIQADLIITRDRGFYRSYFRDLNILHLDI